MPICKLKIVNCKLLTPPTESKYYVIKDILCDIVDNHSCGRIDSQKRAHSTVPISNSSFRAMSRNLFPYYGLDLSISVEMTSGHHSLTLQIHIWTDHSSTRATPGLIGIRLRCMPTNCIKLYQPRLPHASLGGSILIKIIHHSRARIGYFLSTIVKNYRTCREKPIIIIGYY
jgi:hypothetical protein